MKNVILDVDDLYPIFTLRDKQYYPEELFGCHIPSDELELLLAEQKAVFAAFWSYQQKLGVMGVTRNDG